MQGVRVPRRSLKAAEESVHRLPRQPGDTNPGRSGPHNPKDPCNQLLELNAGERVPFQPRLRRHPQFGLRMLNEFDAAAVLHDPHLPLRNHDRRRPEGAKSGQKG